MKIYVVKLVKKSIESQASLSFKMKIVNELTKSKIYEKWKKIDNLIIEFMFNWLFDDVTMNEVRELDVKSKLFQKFDMYLHHQIKRNDIINKNWLKIMMFSFIQQIIRVNLIY